jgi:archaellum component FlaC
MLRGIEDRKRKLENDRWLLRRDPSDSEPAREVATFKARIQELDDEIKRLTAAHDDLSRQNPLILVHLLPKIQALKTQIEQKRDEQYKTRTKLFEAEAKARANLEDKLKAFEELADDLQIQTERSAAYGPLVEEMRKDVEKCAEELEQLKYDRIYKFIQEAKEITGSAIGASRPPADRDALAVQLANLTVRSLTFFDKNVNGYLVNDGELVVSKLGMVYGNGQVRMPDSVKSAFDSLKSTLAGMVQEADETGGYEEIPEWYTERRGKLVRGELKEW